MSVDTFDLTSFCDPPPNGHQLFSFAASSAFITFAPFGIMARSSLMAHSRKMQSDVAVCFSSRRYKPYEGASVQYLRNVCYSREKCKPCQRMLPLQALRTNQTEQHGTQVIDDALAEMQSQAAECCDLRRHAATRLHRQYCQCQHQKI